MNTYNKIDLQLKKINSSRKEMCRNIGVSYNTIASLYQRQSENISLEVLRAISKYLNVSLDYLIFEEVTNGESVDAKKTPPSSDVGVSAEAMEVARAYDDATLKDKNMARMALNLPLVEEEQSLSKKMA